MAAQAEAHTLRPLAPAARRAPPRRAILCSHTKNCVCCCKLYLHTAVRATPHIVTAAASPANAGVSAASRMCTNTPPRFPRVMRISSDR